MYLTASHITTPNFPRFLFSSSIPFGVSSLLLNFFSFPALYNVPWVIVCFRLKKIRWGRSQHFLFFPSWLFFHFSPLLDLLRMKQHNVRQRCLKLLPKSRAVTHQPSQDFSRYVTWSRGYYAFENKWGRVTFYTSVLKTASWSPLLVKYFVTLVSSFKITLTGEIWGTQGC